MPTQFLLETLARFRRALGCCFFDACIVLLEQLRRRPSELLYLSRQHLETRDVCSVALIAAGGGSERIEFVRMEKKIERIAYVCVCVRERESTCVRERERGREREGEGGRERESEEW